MQMQMARQTIHNRIKKINQCQTQYHLKNYLQENTAMYKKYLCQITA